MLESPSASAGVATTAPGLEARIALALAGLRAAMRTLWPARVSCRARAEPMLPVHQRDRRLHARDAQARVHPHGPVRVAHLPGKARHTGASARSRAARRHLVFVLVDA